MIETAILQCKMYAFELEYESIIGLDEWGLYFKYMYYKKCAP